MKVETSTASAAPDVALDGVGDCRGLGPLRPPPRLKGLPEAGRSQDYLAMQCFKRCERLNQVVAWLILHVF